MHTTDLLSIRRRDAEARHRRATAYRRRSHDRPRPRPPGRGRVGLVAAVALFGAAAPVAATVTAHDGSPQAVCPAADPYACRPTPGHADGWFVGDARPATSTPSAPTVPWNHVR